MKAEPVTYCDACGQRCTPDTAWMVRGIGRCCRKAKRTRDVAERAQRIASRGIPR